MFCHQQRDRPVALPSPLWAKYTYIVDLVSSGLVGIRSGWDQGAKGERTMAGGQGLKCIIPVCVKSITLRNVPGMLRCLKLRTLLKTLVSLFCFGRSPLRSIGTFVSGAKPLVHERRRPAVDFERIPYILCQRPLIGSF